MDSPPLSLRSSHACISSESMVVFLGSLAFFGAGLISGMTHSYDQHTSGSSKKAHGLRTRHGMLRT